MRLSKALLFLAACTAAGILNVAALGPAIAGERKVQVSYQDLNLGSDAGRARLDDRISAAVRQVCGRAEMRDLRATASVRRCEAGARAGVKAQRSTASTAGSAQSALGTR